MTLKYDLSHEDMKNFLALDSESLEGIRLSGELSGNILKGHDVYDNNENGIYIESFGVIDNYPGITFYLEENGLEYAVDLGHNVRITFDPFDLDAIVAEIEESQDSSQVFNMSTTDVERDFTGFEGAYVEIESDEAVEDEDNLIDRLTQNFYDQHWPEIDPKWSLKITVNR